MSLLKEEIKGLIDHEENIDRLEAVKIILKEEYLEPKMKEWMTERALKANDDIANERVIKQEDVYDSIKSKFIL
ncbi:MAG: hypothetical protein LH473_08950 [Chitinophagales bacterium]|nr:hypothetical protein [Chitinophagales bacterium]